MIIMENKQYFTTLEILEDLREAITDFNMAYYDDLIDLAFNTVYYISGRKEAEAALEQYGVFDAIGKIQQYERDAFGEVYTDLGNPPAVANMLYLVLGIDTLYNDYPELEEAYYTVLDSEVNDENNKILLDAIDRVIEELE